MKQEAANKKQLTPKQPGTEAKTDIEINGTE